MKKSIGIIGYGNMGSAIGERIKVKYKVFVFDKDKEKTKNLKDIKATDTVVSLVEQSDVVILAVKPQDVDAVLAEIKDCAKNKLIISIAAGITTAYIKKIIVGAGARIIRVMPNLPAKFGSGVSCICKGALATDKDLEVSLKLFKYLGGVFIFDESMMNAVTAVSGSGPGFFFDLIENKPKEEWESYAQEVFIPEFTAAAESLGFSKKEAKLLTETTTRGSLVTVEAADMSPSQLKGQVASKGGTTEAGLEVLHKGGSLTDAVKAAVKRAEELSKKG